VATWPACDSRSIVFPLHASTNAFFVPPPPTPLSPHTHCNRPLRHLRCASQGYHCVHANFTVLRRPGVHCPRANAIPFGAPFPRPLQHGAQAADVLHRWELPPTQPITRLLAIVRDAFRHAVRTSYNRQTFLHPLIASRRCACCNTLPPCRRPLQPTCICRHRAGRRAQLF